MERPRFVRSYETQVLSDHLKELAEKNIDEVTYKELSEVAKSNVQAEGRGALMRARKIALDERNEYWDCIPKVGLRLLTDSQRIAKAPSQRRSIRRKVVKTLKTAQVRDYESLTDAEKYNQQATLTLAAFVGQASSETSHKKILEAVEEKHRQLALTETAETLKLFRSS